MKRIEEHILQGLLVLVVMTLPFAAHINAKAIIVLCAYSLFMGIKYRSYDEHLLHFVAACMAISIVYLGGLLYTTNTAEGFRLLEVRYSLIVFPIVLLFSSRLFSKEIVWRSMLSFVVVVIACGLYMEGTLLLDLWHDDQDLSRFFYWGVSGINLSDRIGIHPTYFSMYAIFCIGVGFEWIRQHRDSGRTVLAVIVIIYLSLLVFHLASRISGVTLLVVLIVGLTSIAREWRLRGWAIIVPIAVFLIWAASLEDFAIRSRLQNELGFNWGIFLGDEPLVSSDNSIDQRVFAWYASAEVIRNNFWFGVGSGDGANALNEIYRRIGQNELAEISLNSHNQYFDAMIQNGLPGLAVLLLLYGIGLIVRRKEQLFVIVAVILILTSVAENILNRQKGTVFVALTYFLVWCYYRTGKSRPPANA